MKLFGFKKKDKVKFQITEADRAWIEENFEWLIKVYGYPSKQDDQMIISKDFFPKAFSTSSIEIENLIYDLSQLFSLDSQKITFETHKDIRDTYGMPFEIQGEIFEAETEISGESYKIHIANNITENVDRLVFSLIYEFIKIRLTESQLEFDTGEDTSLFVFLAGIYFGFGIPLTQNLTSSGRVNDGFWETKWNYVSEMPVEVMTFALALYAKLTEADNPNWKSHLSGELKSKFDNAIRYLNESPSRLFNKDELKANELFNQAAQEYQRNNFDKAISVLQQALPLTNDELLKSDVYNNLGYYQVRNGDYEGSISNFQLALQIEPNYGFAYDNLGYSLIQIGQLDEGKQQLENALKTGNNDKVYSNRNFALYYWASKDIVKAEAFFESALQYKTSDVDLLEFHYADFLLNKGDKEKGMTYLKKAIEKGEPEALELMESLKRS